MRLIEGWAMSKHAAKQALERAITADEMKVALQKPEKDVPSPKGGGARQITAGRVLLVYKELDDGTRLVVTVGLHGGSRDDWEQHVRDTVPYVPPAQEEVSALLRGTSKEKPTRPRAGKVTVTNVWDRLGLHPSVRAQLERMGIDHRDVEVISPTKVRFNRDNYA